MVTYGKVEHWRTSKPLKSLLGGVLLCAAAILVFTALPEVTSGRSLITTIDYWAAVAFALVAIGNAAWYSERKLLLFWVLLWTGFLAEFFGDLFWGTIGQVSFSSRNVPIQDVAYFFLYSLIFIALIYLVALNTRGMALLCPIDVLSVMVSAGILIWYFVLSQTSAAATSLESPLKMAVDLYGPVTDAGFLFLCLLVFSSESRPLFVKWLAGGFVIFLIGDLLYAEGNTLGIHQPGHWLELFRSLGVAMFGLAALRASSDYSSSPVGLPGEIRPWKAAAFWLGPLSPAVQYAFLLAWTSLHPPIPPYVTWAGVALVLYFALRTSAFHRIGHGLRLQGESFTRREEQERISRELHDTVKQNVVGTSMILNACRGAHASGNSAAVEDLLDQALETCSEASYQLSKPIDELAMFSGDGASTPTIYFTNRTRKFGEYFGLHSHADLRAPLEELCPVEVSVAQRVVIEAFWNVAKHSCASNLWLESYREDADFVVRVRDDGRGFCSESETEGMGLGFMRSRASEIGAKLRFLSEPDEGTSVELRLPSKKR